MPHRPPPPPSPAVAPRPSPTREMSAKMMLAAVVAAACLSRRVLPVVGAFSGVSVNECRKDGGGGRPRPRRMRPRRRSSSSSSDEPSSSPPGTLVVVPTGESYSTMTLLEHVRHLHAAPNVRGGDVGDGIIEGAIDFFVNVLGFALDPRSAVNMKEGSGKYDRYQIMRCRASQSWGSLV